MSFPSAQICTASRCRKFGRRTNKAQKGNPCEFSREPPISRKSSQQFLELLPRGVFAGVFNAFGDKGSPSQFEIFAEVADGFLEDRLGPAVAALLGGARIKAGAVEAHAHIGAAPVAALAAAGLAGEIPFPSAFVTMSSGAHGPKCTPSREIHKSQNLLSGKINLKIFGFVIFTTGAEPKTHVAFHDK
jgi:hypothetical protein